MPNNVVTNGTLSQDLEQIYFTQNNQSTIFSMRFCGDGVNGYTLTYAIQRGNNPPTVIFNADLDAGDKVIDGTIYKMANGDSILAKANILGIDYTITAEEESAV